MKKFAWLPQVCCLASGVLAVLALWAWGAGVADMLASMPPHKPTAPSTALLLALISVAVLAFLRRPTHPVVIAFAYATAAFCAFSGMFACARYGLGWSSPFEQWLAQSAAQVGLPLGAMAPLSGAAIAVAGLAVLLQLPPQQGRPAARWASILAALILILAGAVTIARYALAAPAPPDPSSTLSMALLAAVAFVFLGLGLTCAALAGREWSTDHPMQPGSPPPSGGPRSAPLAVFAILILAIGTLGALYLRYRQSEMRTEARQLLKAVGDLKVEEIANWRQERFNDARFFARANFFAEDAQAFLSNPESTEARAALLHWLTLLKAGDRYSLVALFDTNALLRLALPAQTQAAPDSFRELLDSALRTNTVLVTDLFRGTGPRDVHQNIAFPVFPPAARSDIEKPRSATPMGAVVVCLDPRNFLYPLVQSWPTPSRTAETLLVRREGNDVVFLNDLRHQTNSALALSVPIDSAASLPAAMAVRGQTGQAEGVDYRGVRVLADLRPVPDSPWFMVAKVDCAEIFAPLHQQAWLTLALSIALSTAASLVVSLIWKGREAAFARRQLDSERQQRILSEHVQHLMKGANDIILLANSAWRIIEANDRATEAYGRSLAELQGMSIPDLRAPETRDEFTRQTQALLDHGHALFETMHRRKDGSSFPVEASLRMVEIDGARYKLAILRDITQRRIHEREIQRLNRLYAVLSQVNQAIVRAPSTDEMLQAVCRATIEFGGFKLAWIARADPATRRITPRVHAGPGLDFLNDVCLSADGGNGPQCSAAAAMGQGLTRICSHCQQGAPALPCRTAAVQHGLASCAAFPLRSGGAVVGALVLASAEPDFFKENEIPLLEEVAMDVTYALDKFRQDERQQRMVHALRQSEERYRLLADNAEDFVAMDRADGRNIYMSPSYFRLTAWTPEDVQNGGWHAHVHPADLAAFHQARDANLGGETTVLEHRVLCKDGSWMWVETRCRPVASSGGAVQELVVWSHNITARKSADLALRQSRAQLQTIFDNLEEGLIVSTLDADVFRWNPAALHMHGFTSIDEARLKLPEFQSIFELSTLEGTVLPIEQWPLARILRGDRLRDCELRVRRLQGDWRRIFSYGGALVRDTDGRPLLALVSCRDVTDRKQLEEQLRQMQKLEAVGQLAGGIAHDFNNIITTVILNLNSLQAKPGLDADTLATLAEIEVETKRSAGLTRQLLVFGRQSPIQLRVLDLDEVVENLLKMLTRLIGENVRLQFTPHRSLPHLEADPGMLEQVVMNLVLNARDAVMPKGGHVTIATRAVEIGEAEARLNPDSRPGRFARLCVTDDGCGMDEATILHIFEPFFTTKEPGLSAGLGLATVYGIVKQHQGWITVESKVGGGSTFAVFLPATAKPLTPAPGSPRAEPVRGGDESILLVEDEPAVRRTLTAFLRRWGYHVIQAANGPEAIDAWRHHGSSVNLLYTDMVMPGGMSGLDLAEKLRALRPGLKVIVSSGYSAELGEQLAQPLPDIVYIPKPCPPAQLAQQIRRCLDAPPAPAAKA